MKKRLFVLILGVFLIPMFVNAKDYNVSDFLGDDYNYDNGELIVFKEGDRLIADTYGHLYIDNEQVGSCFGTANNCSREYIFTKPTIFIEYGFGTADSIYFSTISENTKIYYYDKDLVEKKIYKSGDVICFPGPYYNQVYYDTEENEVNHVQGYVRIIPKYNGKDALWRLSFIEDGTYAPVSAIFKLVLYKEPEFNLSCNKNTIKYGEKTRCSLSVTSVVGINEVSFDLSTPNFKVTNIKNSNGVVKISGDREYNLRIDSGDVLFATSFPIMSFDIEATKNEVYTDDIFLRNIDYVDDVHNGSFRELSSDLKVLPNTIKNPETYRSMILILLPILILLFSFYIYKYDRKKERIDL